MRSFIDMSGCEFIKNEIKKNNENTQEMCSDISSFNTIENYLIEHNLFQKLVEKTIMYYNIEKTININIEKITINTTNFIKNILEVEYANIRVTNEIPIIKDKSLKIKKRIAVVSDEYYKQISGE